MNLRPVNFKTGYLLDYVPRGARKPRLELVSEVVPAVVREVEELAPALIGLDGEPSLFVHDGLFYGGVEGPDIRAHRSLTTTVQEFEDRQLEITSGNTMRSWFKRLDLFRIGLGSSSIGTAPARDSIEIRAIVNDQRQAGLAYAQAAADMHIIHRGRVLQRVEAPPMISIHLSAGGGFTATNHFNHSNPIFVGSGINRGFCSNEREEAEAFLVRNEVDPIGFKARFDACDTGEWTADGIAAQDTPAWWGLWCLDSIATYPTETNGVSIMMAGLDVVEAMVSIKRVAAPHMRLLPTAPAAAVAVNEALPYLQYVEDNVNRDVRYRQLSKAATFVIREMAAYGPRLSSDADEEVLAGIGAMR